MTTLILESTSSRAEGSISTLAEDDEYHVSSDFLDNDTVGKEKRRGCLKSQGTRTSLYRKNLCVSFSTVEIREYSVCVSHNPSVSCGIPISIRWNPIWEGSMDLKTMKTPKQNMIGFGDLHLWLAFAYWEMLDIRGASFKMLKALSRGVGKKEMGRSRICTKNTWRRSLSHWCGHYLIEGSWMRNESFWNGARRTHWWMPKANFRWTVSMSRARIGQLGCPNLYFSAFKLQFC